jgi:rhodanese-related sulfurtransferase
MDGEISAAELKAALDDGDAPLIVDIRNPAQFGRERIEGSVNVPMSRLPQEVEQISGADHVVTVCPHGKASVRAARLITSFEGFDGEVESLSSGLEGWEGPVEGSRADGDDTGTSETASSDAPF